MTIKLDRYDLSQLPKIIERANWLWTDCSLHSFSDSYDRLL